MSDPDKPGKEQLLATIRSALSDVPPDETPDDVPVERSYRRRGERDEAERLALFVERIEDYKVRVHRSSEADLAAAVGRACAERGAQRLVIPADLPPGWLPDGLDPLVDDDLPFAELDAVDGVITGCAVAVAETGSIILDGGGAQGRRAITLLPDYHLCVVFAEQVAELVPEAFEHLEESGASRRPITLISGPSATSDIELNRVEGVHGPRTLEVLLIER
jgi:L-lactate dehydrogenase complex protein LldG